MTQSEIENALRPLIGLKLSIARRAADLCNFQLGDIRTAAPGIRPGPRGTVGEYALHIQCPWRIDGPGGIVTGRPDLWMLPSGEYPPDGWEPQYGNNRQDERIARRCLIDDKGENTGRQDPETQASGRTNRQQLHGATQSGLQDFFALRAEGDANAQLPEALADRVSGHAENAGNREHRAHDAQHAQRHCRHMRRKQCEGQSIGPRLQGEGQAGIEAPQFAPDVCCQFLRIAIGAHDQIGQMGRPL